MSRDSANSHATSARMLAHHRDLGDLPPGHGSGPALIADCCPVEGGRTASGGFRPPEKCWRRPDAPGGAPGAPGASRRPDPAARAHGSSRASIGHPTPPAGSRARRPSRAAPSGPGATPRRGPGRAALKQPQQRDQPRQLPARQRVERRSGARSASHARRRQPGTPDLDVQPLLQLPAQLHIARVGGSCRGPAGHRLRRLDQAALEGGHRTGVATGSPSRACTAARPDAAPRSSSGSTSTCDLGVDRAAAGRAARISRSPARSAPVPASRWSRMQLRPMSAQAPYQRW